MTQALSPEPPSGRRLRHARHDALRRLKALGPIRRCDGMLWAGRTLLAGDTALVDGVKAATGYGCTIFDRNVRVATSAVAAGTTHRAVGTQANEDITRRVMRLGQSFRGIARTIGKDWVIAYDPLRDVNDRIVGMLAVYRELIDFVDDLSVLDCPEAVLRVGRDGEVLDANPKVEDYSGCGRAVVVGASIERWLAINWANVPPEDVRLEARWTQTDGYTFPAVADTRWLDGGHLVVIRDFTAESLARVDLEQANAALDHARLVAERANEGKSMFLENISHELRTPLTAILGYSQLLLEEPEHDPSADLQRIESSAHYLLSLIDDMLDLSKAKEGHLTVACTEVDLQPLLAEVTQVAEELCVPEVVVTSSGTCTRTVWGDARRIRQVLLNLVSNACKFTERGSVELQITERPQFTDLTIIDTGVGMSPLQQSELFVEFAQVHRSRRVELGGTGLGLALSRRLARAMEGELTVTSEEGAGSRFLLRLRRSASG